MSRKITLLLATLISLSGHHTAFAEEAPNHSLGLSAGWVGGSGVSYRHYIDDSFVQTNAIATMNKDEYREHFELAISYGQFLSHHQFDDAFAPIASKFLLGIQAVHDAQPNDTNNGMQTSREIYSGLGLGLDIINPRRRGMVISLDLYYAAKWIGFSSPELTQLEFLPNAAIRYNF
ncbi:MAG: hypothetical protein OEW58_12055 [Gammaproteobacteria bacterium]|nr:hypothetical protein [Gammaproteobacteria bacterium]